MNSDYNDLPLGELAQNMKEAVADIYHTSTSGKSVVHQVDDESLKDKNTYWLKAVNKSVQT